MTNHPTQGLQDMTLDLSTYSDTGLEELKARIEEEKTKREIELPFEIIVRPSPDGDVDRIIIASSTVDVFNNLELRLSAEAKLRAAGGKKFERKKNDYTLVRHESGDVWSMPCLHAIHGALCFDTPKKAEAAYATLTPDEQASIFGFGEG